MLYYIRLSLGNDVSCVTRERVNIGTPRCGFGAYEGLGLVG